MPRSVSSAIRASRPGITPQVAAALPLRKFSVEPEVVSDAVARFEDKQRWFIRHDTTTFESVVHEMMHTLGLQGVRTLRDAAVEDAEHSRAHSHRWVEHFRRALRRFPKHKWRTAAFERLGANASPRFLEAIVAPSAGALVDSQEWVAKGGVFVSQKTMEASAISDWEKLGYHPDEFEHLQYQKATMQYILSLLGGVGLHPMRGAAERKQIGAREHLAA